MDTADLLNDAVDRIRELVHDTIDGLDTPQLAWQPDEGGNSIGWLLWHLTRVQDDHIADAEACRGGRSIGRYVCND